MTNASKNATRTMANYWEKFVNAFFQFAPSFAVCLSFLPAGLVFGYSIAAFMTERNLNRGVIVYGPMILGACWGLVIALTMYMLKFLKSRLVFVHTHLLLVAAIFHVFASCFYFANDFDEVGAFISYLAHSMTFLAGLSFLHYIPGKHTRAVLLSASFSIYLFGASIAVSLIGVAYNKNLEQNASATAEQLVAGIYVSFAGVYLGVSILLLGLWIGVRVLAYLGTVDCENSMDNDLRIANSNGSIFDNRPNIIKRIQFFYVTRSQQWNVVMLLLYTAAIQYALYVYYLFWFSLNDAVRLTDIGDVHRMFWMTFFGSVVSTAVLNFISIKVNFVATQLCLVVLTVLTMIIAANVQPTVTCWLILFCFGMSFSNLQIALVEVAPFAYIELLIYASYFVNILSTCIIYYYFVFNTKNSYFFSIDQSTLMAQGFVFIIVASLLALIVGMKAPRTHRTSLFDIQYGLLGIIFMKHQIEQLNVKWLNDGTIPTISNSCEENAS